MTMETKSSMSDEDDQKLKQRQQTEVQQQLAAIRRDLLALSIGFGILYGGMSSSQDVQRALNPVRGLQLTEQALFMVSRLIACALLPTVAIDKLGSKGALLLAYGIHVVYLLASLDPRFSTIIPCSIAIGLTNSLLWTSAGVYITSLAIGYCRTATKVKAVEVIITKFFAIFFCIVFASCIIPTLLTSIILNPKILGTISDAQIHTCGSAYCNDELVSQVECDIINNRTNGKNSSEEFCSTPVFRQPPADQTYALGGVYVVLATGAFFLLLCVMRTLVTGQVVASKNNQNVEEDKEVTTYIKRSVIDSLGANFALLRENPSMFLLAYSAFCYGSVEYFFTNDFPKAFLHCVSGYHLQGFAFFTSALFASFTCLFIVWIHSSCCRFWMLGTSTILIFSCILPLFLWQPTVKTQPAIFVFFIFCGIVTAIWNVHLTSIHGLMGRRQLSASFANLLFWWTVGQMLGFVWCELICVQHKLYVLAPLLAGSTLALAALEIWLQPPICIRRNKTRVTPAGTAKRLPGKIRAKPEGSSRNSPVVVRHKMSKAIEISESGGGISTVESVSAEYKKLDEIERDSLTNTIHAPSAPPPPDEETQEKFEETQEKFEETQENFEETQEKFEKTESSKNDE